MSRTHVHAPFWVQRNRAAAKDPFTNIDHDHKERGIYQYERWEEVEEFWDTRVAKSFEVPSWDGVGTRTINVTYRKKCERAVLRTKRVLVGYTSGECDYEPLTPQEKRTYTECEPTWHIGSKKHGRYSYYWHAGWGHSYRDEKDEYWGGARSEERQRTRQWAKEYNSGESLEDMDDYLTYEEDHSFPFWW